MSDIIIQTEGLSKAYHIQRLQNEHSTIRYKTLQEDLLAFPQKLFNKARGKNSIEKLTVWALKDVSLEIKRGEVLGIIGRNGSGKSTLLKILSRITEPTKGHADLHGNVGSLLEVGTGFHPELTGRENVYLSGAILGMRRNEINRKFDEIVAFAEVEKYIDTPVKRYSSGMYVRLAFAVAAHLETEILLVDEVLSVGDASFQKKCLGKMEGVAQHGRTVLFVSHQMGQIATLCTRCLMLDKGQIGNDGPTHDVIDIYMRNIQDTANNIRTRNDRLGSGVVSAVDAWIEDIRGNKTEQIFSGSNIKLCVRYNVKDGNKLNNVIFALSIYNSLGVWLTTLSNYYLNISVDLESDTGVVEFLVPKLSLNSGLFYFNSMIRSGNQGNEVFDFVQNAFYFTVEPGDFFKTGIVTDSQDMIVFDHKFDIKKN